MINSCYSIQLREFKVFHSDITCLLMNVYACLREKRKLILLLADMFHFCSIFFINIYIFIAMLGGGDFKVPDKNV